MKSYRHQQMATIKRRLEDRLAYLEKEAAKGVLPCGRVVRWALQDVASFIHQADQLASEVIHTKEPVHAEDPS